MVDTQTKGRTYIVTHNACMDVVKQIFFFMHKFYYICNFNMFNKRLANFKF